MSRILIGGMEHGQGVQGHAADEADMLAVLESGCGLVFAFSNSAEMLLPEQPAGPCRTDEEGATMLARLCRGTSRSAKDPQTGDLSPHARQIVLAQCFSFRTQLAAFGGEGYNLPATLPQRLACAAALSSSSASVQLSRA